MIDERLTSVLEEVAASKGHICFLTGAGISADSGIPTFRGEEGYWTVGSDVYYPQDMARNSMFRQNPDEVWKWYLMRRGVCNNAEPNQGHRVITDFEKNYDGEFTLVTQNVDGLHFRAGTSLENTMQIHGNINFFRCFKECTGDIYPLDFEDWDDVRSIRCPDCGGQGRPHVLWFDEYYNEAHYRVDTALRRAFSADLLIVIGTTALTNIPSHIIHTVSRTDIPVINIDINESDASRFAESSEGGFIKGKSSDVLPEISQIFMP